MSTERPFAGETKSQQRSWALRALVALGIGGSLWLGGSQWNYTKIMKAQQDEDLRSTDNEYAELQGRTTSSSAIGRFLPPIVGFACWLAAWRRGIRHRWSAPLLFCCAMYFTWCALSTIWSVDPDLTAKRTVVLMFMLIATSGIAARLEMDDFLWVVIFVSAGYIFIGAAAEISLGTFRPWQSRYRFCGTDHPNIKGVQCALLALAAGCARWQRGWPRFVQFGLITVALGGLWLTKSRTTLAAFLVTVVIALLLRTRGAQRWLVLSCCLTLVCVAGIVFSFVSVSAVDSTAKVAAMGRQDDVSSLTGRLPLWDALWDAALERPFLGIGYGGFWNPEITLKYSDMFGWHIPHAHNAYLDMTLNIGAIGLAFYLVWLGASMAVCAHRYGRSRRTGELFGFSVCAFSIVHGIAESWFPGAGLGGIALLTVMMMASVERVEPVRAMSLTSADSDRRRRSSRPRFRESAFSPVAGPSTVLRRPPR